VLPMKMKDILGAPMPFLIGVPEAVYETLRREEIGDVIFNCDKRVLETPFDDVKNMPQELISALKKQLSNPAEHRGDRVSKIFLGILVQLIFSNQVFNDKFSMTSHYKVQKSCEDDENTKALYLLQASKEIFGQAVLQAEGRAEGDYV
jgi:hypothetical protein